jgi:hypothetical protein
MPDNLPVPLPVSLSPADICLRDPLTVDDIASPWTWPSCDHAGVLDVTADLWDAICGGAC